MKITLEWLQDEGACLDSIEKFRQVFGTEADYREILDALVRDDKYEWARWLMNRAGSTKTVLQTARLWRKRYNRLIRRTDKSFRLLPKKSRGILFAEFFRKEKSHETIDV